MYFKKLEIFGFKSFADKTILNFEPGITAVVGPNGCGKSNIFDSIRWVLGEQSIKELRGASKEDVIFNGTQTKPSLGFAEVSLTFANDSRQLPLAYDEVTIARRLFRSGESEYLLNKTVVRLKDIQELLMGTGIGAEAYSLVQQGKVDLVVSARPEDRRMILDEASGITKYKVKKREALNRLKDTENNLLRVNDIVVEVKRQIASSERQANKARRYKDEFVKLKDLEIESTRRQILTSSKDRELIETQLEDRRQKEAQSSKELEELAERLTQEINHLGELEKKIHEIHSAEIKLDGQIDLDNRQIGFNQERSEHLDKNDQKLQEQKQQLIERCRLQQEKIQELHRQWAVLEETLEVSEQKLSEKREGLKSLEALIRDAKSKIQDNEETILNLTSTQVSLRNVLTDVVKDTHQSVARKRRLDMENEKVSCEKQQADQKLQNVKTQIDSVETAMRELNVARESKEEVFEVFKNDLNAIEHKIDELEKKSLFLKSQKEFIEKMHTQYEDMPDPVVTGHFITKVSPQAHHTGIIGKVKEVREVSGEEVTYEVACETKFIELDPQQISKKIEEITEEINTLVLQKESIVEKIHEQESSLKEIAQEILNKEKFYSILESQKKDTLEEARKLSGELELVDLELSEVKETLTTVHKKEEEVNYKLDTVNKDIGWCQNDIKMKQDWIAAKLEEKEDSTVHIAQVETEIKADKEKLASQQSTEDMFAQDLDSWLEEIKRIEDEIEESKLKRQEYAKEIETLNEKIVGFKKSKEALSEEQNIFNAQKIEASNKVNQLRSHMNDLEDEFEGIKQKIHDLDLESQKVIFNEKAVKDRLLQTYQIDFDDVMTPKVESAEPQESSELQTKNEGELNEEITRLKKRCDAFGSVNLMAIEEYDELKERFEFLTQQQADLIEAKSQLMSTINKINRSTKQMFMDTFTKVSEEFRIYFRMLFGGGEAELILLDPENVLECGIDIVARPPGKKLQNISLLSGGEKTLTAIALIFGVFKVKPSPFCVLDEIDAALDESNVGRFSYLLKEFSKIAQFIVITHNKKTMAHADVMYGITMPETGVSRIVSVKFPHEKQKVQEQIPAGV